jgi:hypothetical protein
VKNISTTLLRQSGEKYFDYFAFNIIDYGVNSGLLRSGLAVARSRTLSAMLGGSTSTRPGVQKLIPKTYDLSISATRRSQQRSGARQQLCL